MKRLIALTAMLGFAAAASAEVATEIAEDNHSLYGNVIWDLQLQDRVEVAREQPLPVEAASAVEPNWGQLYGSVLIDIGVDPFNFAEGEREFAQGEIPDGYGEFYAGDTYGSIIWEAATDPFNFLEEDVNYLEGEAE